ncbi:MAG: hypothetical protein WBY12_04030 [Hyphomicrobium sp.]
MTESVALAGEPPVGTPDIGPKEPAPAVLPPADPQASIALDPYVAEPEDYGASTLRTTIFCLVFLLLLPFFASLPAMIGMRAAAGHLADNLGLLVLGAVFTSLMFLVFVEMMFSIRTRVHLGREKVRMTLPSGRGPTPMLRYRSYEFPYDQVHSVETRREIYGGALVPVLMKGARVNLKDGSVVRLGYVSEADSDPVFPYVEIAGKIAERSRLPLIDRGSVRRSVRSKMLGVKATDAENTLVEDLEIARLNASHNNFMLALIGVLLLLMLVGIVEDFARGSPIGQTASAPQATAARLS